MGKNSKKEMMIERMNDKREEVKTVRRIVLWIVLAFLAIVVIGSFSVYQYIASGLKPVDENAEEVIEVEIPIGSGLDFISKKLADTGIIKDARVFKYYAKFNNESQFQAGTYGLTKAMTLDELIESLKTGTVYREPVFTLTIPEGLTVEQIGEIIEKETDISADDFLTFVDDEQTIDELMAEYPNVLTDEIKGEQIRHPLEGYLFPATYSFYEEDPSLSTIVKEMVGATATNVTPYLDYLEQQGKSVHWLLTFSSLREKEATAQADRETIASVFYNRISEEVDMPLQTDPTVLYALGEHKDRVLYKDLEIDNPYNTYKNKGMPPGPIAGAGASSIEAVIDPSETNYLYFLADKEGINHFAETYEKHLENRAKYIDNN